MPPQVPELLLSLVAEGRWPQHESEQLRQNLVSLVPEARVKAFAPEEEQVYLLRPPFHTVADLVEMGTLFFLSSLAAPGGLDFDKAVLVGDFGLGSDAPIVLDYRTGSPPPRVLRLRWGARAQGNEWVEIAPSFAEFVDLLGI